VLSTGWSNANTSSRFGLRRLRRGIRSPSSSSLHPLRYVSFLLGLVALKFSTGHILCAPCCLTIVEKTSSRLLPVCPFCREQFTYDSVRLVRLDFSHSGRSTPRRLPVNEATHEVQPEALARRAERLMQTDDTPKPRSDVRRLQDKVARVAATKTSVEEVSNLHRELEDWLSTAERDEQVSWL
jgi:hypothetical protein